MQTVTLKGNEIILIGDEVVIGQSAPVVKVVNKDLGEITVAGIRDKYQIILAVPSLDTSVCASEARKFNEKAAQNKGVNSLIVVSMDLPFAMGRFCTTEGIENLDVGSDFRNKEFAKKYGILINDGPLKGLIARAIFIVDPKGILVYKQIVPEITSEPDYEDVFNFFKSLENFSCSCDK